MWTCVSTWCGTILHGMIHYTSALWPAHPTHKRTDAVDSIETLTPHLQSCQAAITTLWYSNGATTDLQMLQWAKDWLQLLDDISCSCCSSCSIERYVSMDMLIHCSANIVPLDAQDMSHVCSANVALLDACDMSRHTSAAPLMHGTCRTSAAPTLPR